MSSERYSIQQTESPPTSIGTGEMPPSVKPKTSEFSSPVVSLFSEEYVKDPTSRRFDTEKNRNIATMGKTVFGEVFPIILFQEGLCNKNAP